MSENVFEWLLLAKERFFRAGISPREFGKLRMSDIRDVRDISEAWDIKADRESRIRKVMSEMR